MEMNETQYMLFMRHPLVRHEVLIVTLIQLKSIIVYLYPEPIIFYRAILKCWFLTTNILQILWTLLTLVSTLDIS